MSLVACVAIAAASKPAGGRAKDSCAADYHNCYASKRCCDSGSRCYTKAAGVRFAQCRPNGCVGTCGWECRLHSHGLSAHVEFGANAQNVSQAIVAMKKPLTLGAGMLPTGRSERLGNIIDSCPSAFDRRRHRGSKTIFCSARRAHPRSLLVRAGYFASLGVGFRISSLIAMSCNAEISFGRYLATRLGQISATPEQAGLAIAELSKHESWGFYTYPTIRALMPQLRHDLRAAMRGYSEAFDPSLMRQTYEGGSSHLVVHYRLGDFVTNRWCVPPRDIAAAAAELSPSVVEIMDGGVRHLDQIDGWSQSPHKANRSRIAFANRVNGELQLLLEQALRAAVPSARFVRHMPVSIDADWYRVANAPMLITGAGSFAVTAAIAGLGRQIRTPAADNLNFPDRGPSLEAEALAHNWRTYSYDRAAMQG